MFKSRQAFTSPACPSPCTLHCPYHRYHVTSAIQPIPRHCRRLVSEGFVRCRSA
ncbi:hypothetical protein BC826DRAFT_1055180 [Russula brevipes]|nr:hypothetical protein BC826DRAFT_1055180 [Russula brevipes]